MSALNKNKSGFSLVETALVIAVIGIILGGSAMGYAQSAHMQRTADTKERLDKVMNVLSTYVQRHNRLPCPADPSAAGANAGTEKGGGTKGCYYNASAAVLYQNAEGVLPWRTLGIPVSMARDAWGRMITYKPAPHLTADTTDPAMKDTQQGNDPLNLGNPATDIANACRSVPWFSEGSIHANRAQALFCCNAPPKEEYLGAGETPPSTWRDNSVRAAGQGATASLMETGEWMDDETAASAPVTHGQFTVPHHKGFDGKPAVPDAPLIRSSNNAVTLISHGNNGSLAHDLGSALKLYSAVTNMISGSERDNADPAQAAATAGTVYNPKLSYDSSGITAYDPSGRQQGKSDDIVSYIRSDKLYAKAGRASCRPAVFKPICTNADSGGSGFGSVGWVLDTSGSMADRYKGDPSSPYYNQKRIVILKDIAKSVAPMVVASKSSSYDPSDKFFMQTTQRANPAGPSTNDVPLETGMDDPTVPGYDSTAPGSTVSWVENQIDALNDGGNSFVARAIVQTVITMEENNPSTPTRPNVLVIVSDGLDNGGARNSYTDGSGTVHSAGYNFSYPSTAPFYNLTGLKAVAKWLNSTTGGPPTYPNLRIYVLHTYNPKISLSAKAKTIFEGMANRSNGGAYAKVTDPDTTKKVFEGWSTAQTQECM